MGTKRTPSAYSVRNTPTWSTIISDWDNLLLLLLLYTLQGIPIGLSASVPFMLQEKLDWDDQAVLSIVSLPFSMKLLWAPLVDGVYSTSFGRRKSWLIPTQFVCSLIMIAGSFKMKKWIGESSSSNSEDGEVQIYTITMYFAALFFTMATQDIAVDGWALTMLARPNVGYASTCNTIGQQFGFCIAYVGFLALNDAHASNKYFRRAGEEKDEGLVSLGDFLYFWGWAILITTLYLMFFKSERKPKTKRKAVDSSISRHDSGIFSIESQRSTEQLKNAVNNKSNGNNEDDDDDDDDDDEEAVVGLWESYKQLLRILSLPAVQQVCLVLLTVKVAFAVTDSATTLKLTESGMTKQELTVLSPLLIGFGILIPMLSGRFTSGARPLTAFLCMYPVRLLVGLLYAGMIEMAKAKYSTGTTAGTNAAPPGTEEGSSGGTFAHDYFYPYFFSATILREVAASVQFVSQMSFFARVSDPAVGGTYMTLLNTVANLGGTWTSALALSLMDNLNYYQCTPTPAPTPIPQHLHLPVTPSTPTTTAAAAAAAAASVYCGWGGAPGEDESAPPGTVECLAMGGRCSRVFDAYYVELTVCTVLGLLWLLLLWPRVDRLQRLPLAAWKVKPKDSSSTSTSSSQYLSPSEEYNRKYKVKTDHDHDHDYGDGGGRGSDVANGAAATNAYHSSRRKSSKAVTFSPGNYGSKKGDGDGDGDGGYKGRDRDKDRGDEAHPLLSAYTGWFSLKRNGMRRRKSAASLTNNNTDMTSSTYSSSSSSINSSNCGAMDAMASAATTTKTNAIGEHENIESNGISYTPSANGSGSLISSRVALQSEFSGSGSV